MFVAGKCPDFINKDEQLIVEFFGDYWHRNNTQDQIKQRVDLFKSQGYETLIIWEHELKDRSQLENKLRKFILGETNVSESI